MKNAIVTGASGGIGKKIVDELRYNGWSVYEVNSKNCDVRSTSEIEQYVSKISKIDLLVNCAGISHLGYIETLSTDDIKKVYDINVLGTINFCQAVLPKMKNKKYGYIINMGSLRGIECCRGKAAYSMSKFAVRAFSLTLGLEVKKFGIKVTCINPGFVYTDLIKHRIIQEKLNQSDILQPSDIAKTVIYLLSLSRGTIIPEINLGEVWE